MYPLLSELPPPSAPPALLPYDGYFHLTCTSALIARTKFDTPAVRCEFRVEDKDMQGLRFTQAFPLDRVAGKLPMVFDWAKQLPGYPGSLVPADQIAALLENSPYGQPAYVAASRSDLDDGTPHTRVGLFVSRDVYEMHCHAGTHRRPLSAWLRLVQLGEEAQAQMEAMQVEALDPYVRHRKALEARGIESPKCPPGEMKILAPIDHPDYA